MNKDNPKPKIIHDAAHTSFGERYIFYSCHSLVKLQCLDGDNTEKVIEKSI